MSDSHPVRSAQDFFFGREAEMAELSRRFEKRQSFLLHGSAGVGKTFLLTRVARPKKDILYCPQSITMERVVRSVASALVMARDARARNKFGARCEKSLSALSRKGAVLSCLEGGKYAVVLDHLARPSRVFADSVREFADQTGTAIVPVARSAHMEDSGFVLDLFPDRTKRFEIADFPAEQAIAFAREAAARAQSSAQNLEEFLARIAELSGGNPGAIVSMIRMAARPEYRSGENIKITPLYLDYRMNWHGKS